MAPKVFTDFVALVSAHPFLTAAIVVLFTPPFFPIVKFFSPLLISTALFVLLLFTMGPKGSKDAARGEEGEEREWEGRNGEDGGGLAKLRRHDGGWMDWVRSIEETSLAFMSPRARQKRENWKAVNDGNVSILEDASWAKGADFSSYAQGDSGVTEESSAMAEVSNSFMPAQIGPSMLFKVDSSLKAAAEQSIYDGLDLGEDAPELEGDEAPDLEDVEEPYQPATPTPAATLQQSTSQGLQHQPMEILRIPRRVASEASELNSPATDVDSLSDFSRTNSVNASFRVSEPASDADTPAAQKLSLSGKLHQMEELGDFIHDSGNAEQAGHKAPELDVLQPTTDEQVQSVKNQLDSFIQEKSEEAEAPSATKLDKDAEKPVSKVEEAPATKPAEPEGEISEVH